MGLIRHKTQIADTRNVVYLPSEIPFIAEGMAITHTHVAGHGYGRRSNADTDQQFIGVAFEPARGAGLASQVWTQVAAPATGALVVSLARQADASSMRITRVSNGATLTQLASNGTPVAGTSVAVGTANGVTTLTFAAGDAGVAYNVTGRSPATARDINMGYPGFPDTNGPHAIDVIDQGSIITASPWLVTDCFDTSANWALTDNTPAVCISTGGLFLPGDAGVGTPLNNVQVLKPPTVDDLTLTLAFSL